MAAPYWSERKLEDSEDQEKMERDSNFMCKSCSLLKRRSSRLKVNGIRSKRSNMCFITISNLTICLNIVLIWMCSVSFSEGFNLDTTKAVSFNGPNSGSYFGFTVEMMNKDPRNKWILFGAPKDQNPNLPNIEAPGAVYKQTYSTFGPNFGQVFIDDTTGQDGVDFNGTLPIFEHGRDNQWLGASIDVNENQGVVICASRWYNRYFLAQDQILFMNGLCYLVPLDFNRNNIKKIPALINKEKQTRGEDEWNYGMGCLGSSAHYTRAGNDVLLGTPGLWDWTGGYIDLRQTKAYITQHSNAPTDLNEMAGYALSSGIYFSDGITYFAIGAPRQSLVGAVFLISSIKTSQRLSEADHVLNASSVTGIVMPVNSFFGAALCSVDVNNDGRDDLLVGAPMYSQPSTKNIEYVEEGAVFVFLGGNTTFQPNPTMIRGSEAKMARFGSAISSIGDLNKDMYNDIVVGAPYENDNEGAIYIYNGCKKGIYPTFSQKIPGSVVSPGIKSFGAALSKSYSMNDDQVNDITVGAYLSDKAFLLYGQPVINVDFEIRSNVEQIDTGSAATCPTTIDGKELLVPCFRIRACASYSDVDFAFIDATITFVLDTYKGEYYRIRFQENSLNEISKNVRIFSGEEKCTPKMVVLIRSTSDLVTPVMVRARLAQRRIQSSTDIQPTLNLFDGDNPDEPLLDKKKRIDFKKDCPNNDCQTDLHLAVQKYFTSYKGHFVLGTSVLDVDVSITKSGHPSYGSSLFIAMHKVVQFRKVQKLMGEPEIDCAYVELPTDEDGADSKKDLENDIYELGSIPEVEDNEKLLSCSFGNPMSSDEGVKFRLTLVIPGLVSTTTFPFRLNATTLSNETSPADNVAVFNITAKNMVSTEFNGVSRPSFMTVKDDEQIYHASHVLELGNFGPSILPEAQLTIRYPQVQIDGKAQLYLNKTTWSCRRPCEITCAFPDTEYISPEIHSAEKGPTYYVNESPSTGRVGESIALSRIKHVDCTKSTCSRYECSLRNISPRESAVVALEFVINKEIIGIMGGQTVTIKTDSYIRFRAQDRLITNVTEHSTTVFTDVQPKSPPPEPLAWWIILISVLAGLLLIALMVFIMWKCGFFVRKEKDEMEKRMQVEGKVMMQDEDGFNEDNDIKKEPL